MLGNCILWSEKGRGRQFRYRRCQSHKKYWYITAFLTFQYNFCEVHLPLLRSQCIQCMVSLFNIFFHNIQERLPIFIYRQTDGSNLISLDDDSNYVYLYLVAESLRSCTWASSVLDWSSAQRLSLSSRDTWLCNIVIWDCRFSFSSCHWAAALALPAPSKIKEPYRKSLKVGKMDGKMDGKGDKQFTFLYPLSNTNESFFANSLLLYPL